MWTIMMAVMDGAQMTHLVLERGCRVFDMASVVVQPVTGHVFRGFLWRRVCVWLVWPHSFAARQRWLVLGVSKGAGLRLLISAAIHCGQFTTLALGDWFMAADFCSIP